MVLAANKKAFAKVVAWELRQLLEELDAVRWALEEPRMLELEQALAVVVPMHKHGQPVWEAGLQAQEPALTKLQLVVESQV